MVTFYGFIHRIKARLSPCKAQLKVPHGNTAKKFSFEWFKHN